MPYAPAHRSRHHAGDPQPSSPQKNLHPFDRTAYKRRNLVERAFCRIKDFRRVATRYDKLAATYDAAISLADSVTW